MQLPSLAMVAGSNDWWLGSRITQCRLEGGARYVILWKRVHTDKIFFNSAQNINQSKRLTVTCSLRL